MAISARDLLSQEEFWIFLFLLGAALLNWPILSIAVADSILLGFPAILGYVAAVWAIIIVILYLFDRGSGT
jgi:hypothetical protein